MDLRHALLRLLFSPRAIVTAEIAPVFAAMVPGAVAPLRVAYAASIAFYVLFAAAVIAVAAMALAALDPAILAVPLCGSAIAYLIRASALVVVVRRLLATPIGAMLRGEASAGLRSRRGRRDAG